jgi:hypothetical protein
MVNGHAIEVLQANLDALKDVMAEREKLSNERDRLYQEQFAAAKEAVVVGLAAQKEGTASALAASEKALLLKSGETERRLEALNGEAARLAIVLAKSVPREVWEESQRSLNEWRAGVDKQLNTNSGRDRGFGIIWAVLIGTVGLLGGIAVLMHLPK